MTWVFYLLTEIQVRWNLYNKVALFFPVVVIVQAMGLINTWSAEEVVNKKIVDKH